MIDFKDEELVKLRKCYNSLDEDLSGSIGALELEDPLIALGLVDNRLQVQQLIQLVDDDGSELIEFKEFLGLLKKGGSKQGVGVRRPVHHCSNIAVSTKQEDYAIKLREEGLSKIYKFFKDLTMGKIKMEGSK